MGFLLRFMGGLGLSGVAIGSVDRLLNNDSLCNAIVLLLKDFGMVSPDFANYIIVSGNGDHLIWILCIGLLLLAVYKELPTIVNGFFRFITTLLIFLIKIFEKYTLSGRLKSNNLKEQLLESKIHQVDLENKLKKMQGK